MGSRQGEGPRRRVASAPGSQKLCRRARGVSQRVARGVGSGNRAGFRPSRAPLLAGIAGPSPQRLRLALPLPTTSPPWPSLCPCVPSLRDSDDSTELTGLVSGCEKLNTDPGFTPGTGPGTPLSPSQCDSEKGLVPPRQGKRIVCASGITFLNPFLRWPFCPPSVGHILKRLRV